MRFYNGFIKIILLTMLYFSLPISATPVAKSGSEASELNLYTAKYNVLRGQKKYGHATRELKKNSTSYSLSFNTSASIFFYSIDTSETSNFLWQDNTIILLSYEGRDSRSFKKDKNLELKFDQKHRSLIAKKNGDTSEHTFKDGVLDPLMTFEKLRLDAQASDGFSNKEQLHYTVYDSNGFKEYHFLNSGRVIIDTPIGKLNCIKLSRVRKNSTRKTHIWLAIDYDFIPVMLIQEHKEEEVATLIINSIEQN